MKVIRDTIHGYIELDETALSLVDTPVMQRLRRIKQLGLTSFVYPGANHTRFEHSLGTYHLANLLADCMGKESESGKGVEWGADGEGGQTELRVAALLHDIGHGPLSHVTENIIRKHTGRSHEDVYQIIKSNFGEIFERYSISISRVARHIKGETGFSAALNSEIDIDRMDYLVRDAHYTGVPLSVDLVRLIHEMRFLDGKLVIGSGGIRAAESLLLSRFLMYPTVYYHHVTRIAESMCVRAVECMIEDGFDARMLYMMDDQGLFTQLGSHQGYPSEIADSLRDRRLFKRALYEGFDAVGESVLSHRRNVRRVEDEIASAAGIDPEYVLVDIPKPPEIVETKANIVIDQRLKPLHEVSHLVSALGHAQRDNWRMGVYTPSEYRDVVAAAAKEFFGVQKHKQFRLDELIT
ncbi:MAG: phosphohydrolase [Candidatus Methanogaster sp.]|uniref:Phosphohydrolase n=1 Tax=Candidatus Methanogaster sp. TaxID=3386292 RepID=A0AC61L613_9EURY|nr:MAG: phosphohydrolase [ANME-2 cluster archaeon]